MTAEDWLTPTTIRTTSTAEKWMGGHTLPGPKKSDHLDLTKPPIG